MTPTTDSTIDHIINDIIADPADDGLRLIAADWYEDHGEPERAEFIRVQIELARGGLSCDRFMYSCGELLPTLERIAVEGCEKCQQYAKSHLALRRMFQHLWSWSPFGSEEGDFRAVIRGPGRGLDSVIAYHLDQEEFCSLVFRRGFIDEVRCSLDVWLRHGKAITSRQPITRVTATDKKPFQCTTMPNRYRWYDAMSNDPGGEDDLPGWLFAIMHDGKTGDLTWQSSQAALDALSSALIRHARGG